MTLKCCLLFLANEEKQHDLDTRPTCTLSVVLVLQIRQFLSVSSARFHKRQLFRGILQLTAIHYFSPLDRGTIEPFSGCSSVTHLCPAQSQLPPHPPTYRLSPTLPSCPHNNSVHTDVCVRVCVYFFHTCILIYCHSPSTATRLVSSCFKGFVYLWNSDHNMFAHWSLSSLSLSQRCFTMRNVLWFWRLWWTKVILLL